MMNNDNMATQQNRAFSFPLVGKVVPKDLVVTPMVQIFLSFLTIYLVPVARNMGAQERALPVRAKTKTLHLKARMQSLKYLFFSKIR
jgi:hypothetical protein